MNVVSKDWPRVVSSNPISFFRTRAACICQVFSPAIGLFSDSLKTAFVSSIPQIQLDCSVRNGNHICFSNISELGYAKSWQEKLWFRLRKTPMIDLTFPFLTTKNVSHTWSFFSLPEETKCMLSKRLERMHFTSWQSFLTTSKNDATYTDTPTLHESHKTFQNKKTNNLRIFNCAGHFIFGGL